MIDDRDRHLDDEEVEEEADDGIPLLVDPTGGKTEQLLGSGGGSGRGGVLRASASSHKGGLHNQHLVPIKSSPKQFRDVSWVALALVVFSALLITTLVFMFRKQNDQFNADSYHEGGWLEVLLISPLLGACLGLLLLMLVLNSHALRSLVLPYIGPLNIVFRICIGNIFIFHSGGFWFSLGVITIISALQVSFQWALAKEQVNVSIALLELVESYFTPQITGLVSLVLLFQSLFLLWCASLIRLIDNNLLMDGISISEICLIIIVSFSFYISGFICSCIYKFYTYNLFI